jgi:hypothetical protein
MGGASPRNRRGSTDLTSIPQNSTDDEIGAKLGRVERSIQRKLETIRAIWEQVAAKET